MIFGVTFDQSQNLPVPGISYVTFAYNLLKILMNFQILKQEIHKEEFLSVLLAP